MAEGGRRERSKSERRRRILDAARRLAAEEGAGATVERIAQRAGVAPATVYNLVGPRERLWEALAEALDEDLDRRFAERAAHDPLDRARAVVRLTVELLVAEAAVARELLRRWESSGSLLERGPGTRLREALEDARAAGLLREEVDAGALASVVAASCGGAAHQWAAGVRSDGSFAALCLRSFDMAVAAGADGAPRAAALQRLRPRRDRRAA